MGRRHPDWIKVKAPGHPNYLRLKRILREKSLHTVCEEARCPNIGECWGNRTATFLILGDTCTRGCRFCAIDKGKPLALDPEEPRNVALVVKELGLDSHRRHLGQSRRSTRRRRSAFRARRFSGSSQLNPGIRGGVADSRLRRQLAGARNGSQLRHRDPESQYRNRAAPIRQSPPGS